MLDYNSHDLSEALEALLDQPLEQRDADTPPRAYLGASSLGEDCARKLQYQFFAAPKDPGRHFPGRVLRVFARGHRVELWMAEWLRLAGFELATEQADGGQFGFSLADGLIRGHADGVLLNGPALLTYPALWESKAVGHKTFGELKKKRLALSRPVYAAQIALYQAYLGLHEEPALFTAINVDTMDVYAERVPFDAALAQRMSDRAGDILRACEAAELLPRFATTSSHYECRFCAWQDRCWSQAA